MGTLIGIDAKASTLQGYQLESSQDMHDALAYLSVQAAPYTGSINCQLVDVVMTWWLVLVSPHGVGNINAYVGDWIIVENGTAASVCRAADFDTFYTVP